MNHKQEDGLPVRPAPTPHGLQGIGSQYPELQPKRVIEVLHRGLSWEVRLECGHTILFYTEPGGRSFCSQCTDDFLKRLKNRQVS